MRYLFIMLLMAIVIDDGWSQQEQGFVPISDGKLYYEKRGSGPPLIFLHGVCLDHRMWQQQTDYFSSFYTCITMDLRGFGQSSVPATTPYSFHEDVKTLLDSLHINEPVVLVALSMGGKGAINFSLAYPALTKALVLADVAVDGYRFREFKLERIAEIAQQKGIDIANQAFLEDPIFVPSQRDSAVFNQLRQMVLSYSGWHWIHKNPVQGLTPPAIEQLQQIKMPVLIITGEKDITDFQQIADTLHKEIKRSSKKVITGAGHMCNMEKPGEFNRLVFEFLSSVK